jgi:DNA-binding PadR family transcriptional regulator
MYARHILVMTATDRDRIDVHLPLRPVEFHILLSLAGGARHGYGIIQDIEARDVATTPDVGTMYRALARMVEQRLIEAAASTDPADDRRNYYRITTRGLRVAKAEARRLEALAHAARISGLLEKKAT